MTAYSSTTFQIRVWRRVDGLSKNSQRATSLRPGTHEIGFDSAADTITVRHVARSRDGFAHGALKAAQWILGRKGVYTFDDVLFGRDKRQ